MEFFICPCPATATVILDGSEQGSNKDAGGQLLTKECNNGIHCVALKCADGKSCSPNQVTLVIAHTDPISPQEVAFQCV